MKNKMIIASIVIVIIFLIFYIIRNMYFFDDKYETVSDLELRMVEKYLNNRYNLKLKIIDYNYVYFDKGFNGGSHYYFDFKPIGDIEIKATLNYEPLKNENLKDIMLNVTNIDLAKNFQKYIEEKTNLFCKLKEYRLVENEDKENYYSFRILLNKDINCWIDGTINEDDEEYQRIISFSVSDKILNIVNLDDVRTNTFEDVLQRINKYSNQF